MSRTTLVYTAAGFVFGLVMLASAILEAGAGHGTYVVFGIASLPALVFGIGKSLVLMFLGPVLQ